MNYSSSPRLTTYLYAVYAAAACASVLLILTARYPTSLSAWTLLAVTGALVFLGEILPIQLWRQGSINEYTFSGAFCVPLVVTGPISFAVAVQVAALLVQETRQRKPPRVTLFNVGQYVLTLMAARLVVCSISGVHYGAYDPPAVRGFVPALVAAAGVFFLVNVALSGVAVGLNGGYRLLPFLGRYLRDEFPVTPMVLGLAPVVYACMTFSVWTVPLSVLLVIALRRATASAREHEIASLHDPLTGMPNRTLFMIRLTQSLNNAAETGNGLALLMLDLDHFKEINDTLGHHVGDELLRMVARRLEHGVRADDTVARLGGDEFAVLVQGATERDAAEVAERLAGTLSENFGLVGVTLNVEASVGVALAPQHGTDAETLIRYADIALYAAKQERGSYVFYDSDSDEHTVERLALMGELRQGLERGELLIEYQPKVDTATRRVVSVEALLRWRHPTRGIVMPNYFIPAAENTGLILPLTDFVLDESLGAVRGWRDGGLDITVAINVTARHVTNLDLPDQVAAALRKHGLPGEVLILEVTERCLMSDPARVKIVLARLRTLGVKLSIDDFGTGYSSFSSLRDLAVNEIKIDRSFVSELTESAASAAIVKSAIDLGHNLSLQVVAEGVETVACLDALTALGCDVVQGFLFARPMPGDQLLASAALLEAAADISAPSRQVGARSAGW